MYARQIDACGLVAGDQKKQNEFQDKLFPKTNSLLDNRTQPLADIEEFALKIKVIKYFNFRKCY